MSNENTETSTEQQAGTEQVSSESMDWKTSLPDDIKADPTLSNITDVSALAKSYVNAQRMIGSRIAIPSKDASDEARNEFYSKLETVPGVVRLPSDGDEKAVSQLYDKLGRPVTADKYKLDFPEGLQVDEEYVGAIKKAAHSAGLNNAQLAKLAEVQVSHEQKLASFVKERKANSEEFLKKEWGAAYDDHSQLVDKVLTKYESKFPDAVKEIRETSTGDNPVVKLLAAELGKLYAESGTILPNAQGKPGLIPDEALEKIAEIKGNLSHAYHNDKDPAHADAVAQMTKLYSAAYPDTK